MPSLKIGTILGWQPSRLHPETHWKHETPLSDCDCITRVTHDVLTVVASGILSVSNIVKLGNFLGYNSLTTERLLHNILFKFGIQQCNSGTKHMSSNTCHV